ncbi:hypothetical protein C0033_11940 [Clostridium sp. chh4-2]|nr:hypothetical protein C0033_11940 [Clostridium sp. chh4-2]
MIMKLKKITALIAAAALAASMTACSGKSAAPAQSQGAQGETAGKSDTQTAASGEKIKLEYYSHKSETEAIKAMDLIIEAYEKEHPNVEITQTSVPDAKTVLLTRIASNDMPDIVSFSTSATYDQLFEDGLLTDITGQDFLDNINPTAIEMAKYDGKLYRLPIALSSWGIYANKDMFDQNNIELPATYDELMSACEKLQAAGITPFINEDKETYMIGQRMERMVGIINNDSDTEFRKIAAGEMSAADSETLKTYAKGILDMKKYGAPDSLGVDHQSAIADFVNGKGAMYVFVTSGLVSMKSSNPDMNIAMIPYPDPAGVNKKVPISIDTNFAVFTSCKHPEEALDFLRFLSTTEAGQIYADNEGSPNMVKGVNYNVPEFKAITEKMDAGDMFESPNAIWPSGLREDMRTPAQQLLMDGDIDTFLESCGEAITAKYNEE